MLGRRQVGSRVILVPRLPEHTSAIYRWYEYPDFAQRLRMVSYRYHCHFYEQQAAGPNLILWSILRRDAEGHGNDDRETLELVGMTMLNLCRRGRECRDSYTFVIPEARGRGYASEALELQARYAFAGYSVDLLHTGVDQDNLAMRRVLEKVGYKGVGSALWSRQRHEQEMYVLRREWWETKHAHRSLGSEEGRC